MYVFRNLSHSANVSRLLFTDVQAFEWLLFGRRDEVHQPEGLDVSEDRLKLTNWTEDSNS